MVCSNMFKSLSKLIGGKTVNIPKRPGEPDCTWADITKAKLILDWTPKYDFHTSLKRVIKWYYDND